MKKLCLDCKYLHYEVQGTHCQGCLGTITKPNWESNLKGECKVNNKFKVGDLVVGIKDSIYNITNHNCVGEVTRIYDRGAIDIIITEHKNRTDKIGEVYTVDEKYFKSHKVGFKVGDLITGINDNKYRITNSGATCEVIEIFSNNQIKIKLISHISYIITIGSEYYVDSEYFKLVKPNDVNLVFIKYEGAKHYLFLVPEDKSLFKGDKVFTDTKIGETVGICVSDSFTVNDGSFKAILWGMNIKRNKMKYVTGYAVEQEQYKKSSF